MKTIIQLCLLSLLPLYAISQCEDPTIQIVSDCGTEFDLCLDEYSTGQDIGILLEIFVNDDLGIFDPCDSDTLSGTSNGSLTQLPDCNWFYQPNPGYIGNDTFYYVLNYNDVCVTECYCSSDPGCIDGRIWTIDALYLGEDGSDNGAYDPTILVKDKNGNTFSTHEHLSWGDDFFADGSALHQSTTNYEYQLFLEGDTTLTPDEIVFIHVSCSEEIFGQTYGFVRPISGCVAPTSQSSTCAGVGDSLKGEKEVDTDHKSVIMGEPISSETTDTTIVTITITNPIAIPIEILKFNGAAYVDGNSLSWHVYNDMTKEIHLLRSSDGRTFNSVYMSMPTTLYSEESFMDNNPYTESYYKLMAIDHNGTVTYSDVVVLKNDAVRQKSIDVFPNPFDDYIILSYAHGMVPQSIRVFDNYGALISELVPDNNDVSSRIELGDSLNNGIYFIIIEGDGWSSSNKIVKL